jgi:hypothetical protein
MLRAVFSDLAGVHHQLITTIISRDSGDEVLTNKVTTRAKAVVERLTPGIELKRRTYFNSSRGAA